MAQRSKKNGKRLLHNLTSLFGDSSKTSRKMNEMLLCYCLGSDCIKEYLEFRYYRETLWHTMFNTSVGQKGRIFFNRAKRMHTIFSDDGNDDKIVIMLFTPPPMFSINPRFCHVYDKTIPRTMKRRTRDTSKQIDIASPLIFHFFMLLMILFVFFRYSSCTKPLGTSWFHCWSFEKETIFATTVVRLAALCGDEGRQTFMNLGRRHGSWKTWKVKWMR